MPFFLSFLVILVCSFAQVQLNAKEPGELAAGNLEQESEKLRQLGLEYVKFYELPQNVDLLDITGKLLSSSLVKDKQKEAIQAFNRKIFVFNYLSEGLKIKGLISFVPHPQNQPLLVFLRGGNREFGLLNPGGDFLCSEQYTVLVTFIEEV